MTIAIILLAAGFCLIVLEVFVPSGGLLSVLAVAAMIASIYFAFAQSQLAGFLFLAGAVIGAPLLAWQMLKLFPKTSVGRSFLLFSPKGHEEVATSSELKLREYEGKQGITKTTLRPAGVAEIEGERVNVVSEGMIIESGRPVKVLEVSGNRVVVREIEEEVTEESGRNGDTDS